MPAGDGRARRTAGQGGGGRRDARGWAARWRCRSGSVTRSARVSGSAVSTSAARCGTARPGCGRSGRPRPAGAARRRVPRPGRRSATSMPLSMLCWYEAGRSSTGIVVAYSVRSSENGPEVLVDAAEDRDDAALGAEVVLPLGPRVGAVRAAGDDDGGDDERRRDAQDGAPPGARALLGEGDALVVVAGRGGLRERGGLLGRGDGDGPGARASGGRRPDDLGLGGRSVDAGDVDEVADDDGDVVGGAGPQGEGDEPVGALAGVGGGRQDTSSTVSRAT